MKSLLIRALAITVTACFISNIGACNKGHASSPDSWSLSLNKNGSDPSKLIQYKFTKGSWGKYLLTMKTKAEGVNGEELADLVWKIVPSQDQERKRILELELISLKKGKIPSGPQWDAPPSIMWELSPTGRTRRFGTSLIYNAGADGLGDPQAYFRRLVPVLPEKAIGEGAQWTLKRLLQLPLPRDSGKGQLNAHETIEYKLKSSDKRSNKAVIEADIKIRYKGDLEPVGHFLKIRGTAEGKLKAIIDLDAGHLRTAELRLKEKLNMEVDGHKRKVTAQMTYTLRHAQPSKTK